MVGQSVVVHGPLPFTHMHIAHILHLWGQAGLNQGHLHSGSQCHAQIFTVYISSVVVQGNWTKFPVEFLFVVHFGISSPRLIHPTRTITSCGGDQMFPETEVTLFLKSKVIVVEFPD